MGRPGHTQSLLVMTSLSRLKLVWCTCTSSDTNMRLRIEFRLYGISTGEPDRPPCKVGVAATDIATGLYAHGAIMAGLISQECTGCGLWIDCNLLDSQISHFPSFLCILLHGILTPDCQTGKYCIKLSHHRQRGVMTQNNACIHHPISSIPMQGWVLNDWCWQWKAGS